MALRRSRNELGWSQEELEDKAGVALGTIKHAENGRPITPKSYARLVEAINKELASRTPPRPLLDMPYP